MLKIVEKIGVYAAAFTVALLAVAVIHEYGYFLVIGSHFQTLLTATDYFSNAILWLPLAFSVYGMADWHLLGKEKPPAPIIWMKPKTWVGPLIILLWLALTFVSNRTIWIAAFVYLTAFVVLWSRFWIFLVPKIPDINADDAKRVKNAIRLGPPLVAAVFIFGVFNASSDLEKTDTQYSIKLEGQDVAQPRLVLRTFDKGLLVRNLRDDRVDFYKWSDLKEFSKSPGNRESYLCQWFSVNCLPDKKPAAPSIAPTS